MIDMPEGKIGEYFYDVENNVWTVRLQDGKDGSDSYMDCKTQIEAEILSRIVKIEITLAKIS